jgi:hypothetical protein
MMTAKQLLAESFHRELTSEERGFLNKALENDQSLRKEKEEIEKTVSVMKNYDPRFREGFSGRVMDKLFSEETRAQIIDLYPVFKKIFWGGVAATVALLLSVYFTDGSINTDALMGLSDLNSEELLMALMNF